MSAVPPSSGDIDVLSLGEVVVDVFGEGRELPGGAPANVACHAAALGSRSVLVTRIGRDERGRMLSSWLGKAGVGMEGCQVDGTRPTGEVKVEMRGQGPAYEIATPAAWDFLEAPAEAEALARRARVMVLGTLAQRRPEARTALRRLVAAGREAGARLIVDLNLRAPFFDEEVVLWTLRQADVLKLNGEELAIVAVMLGARGDRRILFEGLVREFGVRAAVLTCGEEGALFHEAGEGWQAAAVPCVVADTVGAGDVFTAVMAAGLAGGRSLREVAPFCVEAAAWVASQRGATPRLPRDLVKRWQLAEASGGG